MFTTSSGAHIDFSAAVWSTRPNVQVLSPALPFFYHRTDTRMRAMIAHHFGALRNALRSLEQCYEQELSNKAPRPIANLEFLYPLWYTCISTSSIRHFRYLSHMDDSKLLFAAETDDDEKICIKFIRHYSKDVHTFCASEGFGPILKGFEELPGGWHMVVMEMIGEDYCCLIDFPPLYSHFDDIMAKLTSLHQANYVHGDAHDTNIMVKKGFKLVDFDWSGRIGEVRYPMNIY
jgi:RIO1 family